MGRLMKQSGTHRSAILLFGSQAASINNGTLSELKLALQDQHWALKLLVELPATWRAASTSIPILRLIPGEQRLKDLGTWLIDGPPKQSTESLSNIILAPLTVLAHLIQYRRYLEVNYSHDPDPQAALVHENKTTTLGFCMGLLAAFAIAGSKTMDEWHHQATIAVRLAMLIGATVDGFDKSNLDGSTESFAIAWKSKDQETEVQRILEQFPNNAYISVRFDELRATLAVSTDAAPRLLHALNEAGLTSTPTGLKGQFHSGLHGDTIDALIRLCDIEPGLTLSDAEDLALPTFTNTGNGEPIRTGRLHELALRAILVQQCNWYDTVSNVIANQTDDQWRIISFSIGTAWAFPPSVARKWGARVEQSASLAKSSPFGPDSNNDNGFYTKPHAPRYTFHNESSSNGSQNSEGFDSCDIAVVGMSVKVAGADDLGEFNDLLRSGKSQHKEVPEERVPFGYSPWRQHVEDHGRKWYGNFMADVDAFDHKFFRKSPRESAALDPQQRLVLQSAYQAVEQSGYLSSPTALDKHIGVYLGTCATDYEHNAACHAASAFTVMGLLRGSISGRVSHYFGWTGPSMTFDTACSGSAVAIHSAVRALVSGECKAALAGGVNVIGNEVWFQNLAGASFLSPTGQCKPFDNNADGYCRGEAIACVFLKPMATAIADGDRIFARIASTAVYQNDNSTPLFVPNEPSMTRLLRDVIRQARLEPGDISLVEAHGTGTPVGDPAEYQSICNALGGPVRRDPLSLGSVKGFVGHTESSSGVISLIKVIIMMHGGFIPSQASHSKMSHRIAVSTSDMVEVPTSAKPWTEEHKAALVNNYGAGGSIAAMVVTQCRPQPQQTLTRMPAGTPFPFRIFGFDDRSIAAYCVKLRAFIRSSSKIASLEELSFNLNKQSNHSLPRGLFLRCGTVSDLLEQLSPASPLSYIKTKPLRPVILCFGGQISTHVGLDIWVYENVAIIRNYLGQCDAIVQSLGYESIYPDIFGQVPITDPVHLQTMLFALQYACAMCWIDCGVHVDAVVGHSFGEITALCVAGVLSLHDAIRLVAGRAEVVRSAWSSDRGSMMAVEGELELVKRLLEESNRKCIGCSPAGIACYNSIQSFTLAGSTPAMERIAYTLLQNTDYAAIRSKSLDVTNAFHSALVDPLLPALIEVGIGLDFRRPVIRLESATETPAAEPVFTSEFVANHMRNPVFFQQAVQRLAKDCPSAIWLEAGSASKITAMARRAVGAAPNSHFQAVSLTNGRGMADITDVTLSLWKEGLPVAFWPHHSTQAAQNHAPLLLPPYQFEKTRHWLELKAAPQISQPRAEVQYHNPAFGLWSFVGYRDEDKRLARFKINTESERYTALVAGHVAVHTAAICPATVEYSMAIQAAFSLLDGESQNLNPIIRSMRNDVPLCVNPDRSAWLDLNEEDAAPHRCWTWMIVTTAAGREPDSRKDSASILCVQGRLELRSAEEATDFGQYERLVTHEQCNSVLRGEEHADDILQGRGVYRSLADVVDYGELYRGVRRVVGRGNECAGLVHDPTTATRSGAGRTWLDDIPVVDSFSQVAGVWVNCMANREPGGDVVYLATGCELIMRSPRFTREQRSKPEGVWHVWARHHRESDNAFVTDVFVFDAMDGRLREVVLGIRFSKIPRLSMSKLLGKLTNNPGTQTGRNDNKNDNNNNGAAESMEWHTKDTSQRPLSLPTTTSNRQEQTITKRSTPSLRTDLGQKLRNVVSNLSGLEVTEIKDDSELPSLGIDSLAIMELSRDIESVFHCKMSTESLLLEANRFYDLVKCVARAVYGEDDETTFEEAGEEAKQLGDDNILETETTIEERPFPIERQNSDSAADTGTWKLSQLDVLTAFTQVKTSTDQRIRDSRLDDTDATILARSSRLCVALIVEAFEQLGCSLRTVNTGDVLMRITHQPQHTRLVNWLYNFLERDARLIDTDGDRIIRTAISVSCETSDKIVQELVQASDQWIVAHRLTYYAGKNLAEVVSGKTDGVNVLFGSSEGRDLMRGLYCNLPFNCLFYEQVRDTIHLMIPKVQSHFNGTLRILEMGAGTGGTTQVLAPLLSGLNIRVEYTVTDLSPSMVAQLRRTFGTQFPFMRFAVHDIETLPAEGLRETQHIVLASNAVHATADLAVSLSNIHKALHQDGVLLLTEMTESLPYVDLVFGLLEGWWRFADSREHAIVSADHWQAQLRGAGFGAVDWTDGKLPENRIQKVIMAQASESTGAQSILPETSPPDSLACSDADIAAREGEAEKYVTQYATGFFASDSSLRDCDHVITNGVEQHEKHNGAVVIITGATGSLGSHLVARFAEDPAVTVVVCINRRVGTDGLRAADRQQEALSSRRITLSPDASAKLRVLATDTTQPHLGLPLPEYTWLVSHGTHIVHNAWPMSASRQLRSFEPQFRSLRRMLDLAADISAHMVADRSALRLKPKPQSRVTFQLISSIGVVGMYAAQHVPEERVRMRSVLPVGYCEAKWVCERLLDETLHRRADQFRAMVIRPGQIAGSSTSGVWNPVEHFAFLVRSAQSLRAFPALDGVLQWVPVDSVAGTIADLALNEQADGPVYHVDNPVGQPWTDMVDDLADELGIPRSNVVPFTDWLRMVKRSPLPMHPENPAMRLVKFLEEHFVRMSCGGIILDTAKAREHSLTLAAQGPVPSDIARLYVRVWKATGFLNP